MEHTDLARVETMGDGHDSPTAGQHRVAHTPGPWTVLNKGVYASTSRIEPFTDLDGTYHADYRTGLVALVYDGDDGDRDANAQLIGAAPELLAALKMLMANPEEQDAHNAAHRAIAKAEGRS
jgi:hypothetical protein